MSAVTSVEVTAACTACGACLPTCPERCLVPLGGRPPLAVLADDCTACLLCVEVCPADAIAEVRAGEDDGGTHGRARAGDSGRVRAGTGGEG